MRVAEKHPLNLTRFAPAEGSDLTASDPTKLRALLTRITELAGGGSPQGVLLDASLFLDGNEDEGSLGCNLEPHPGMARFRAVIDRVRSRPDVASVLVPIGEVMSEPAWPYSDGLCVCTTAADTEVADWFAELQPEEDVYEHDPTGLKGVPATPTGYRWFVVHWD